MSIQKVSDAMIADMASSKLTGTLPAIDGSALTNIPDSVTKNANDPAIDTNPSGGLGTIWLNTTSGEMFILTDATAGENVWTNVGPGTGDVEPLLFYQATIAGFAAGGHNGGNINNIDRFSFTSDANATDSGDMTVARQSATGQSSSTHGYSSTGNPLTNVIDKFQFTTGGNAADVGDTIAAKSDACGHSSETHGYVSGGNSANGNVIEKFQFANDTNGGSDVGDLTVSRGELDGTQSETHGYSCGGGGGNVIDKFPFASNANATDVGDMIFSGYNSPATASKTHGYCSGGTPASDKIGKFSFASNGNATEVGTLSVGRQNGCGNQSSTHGYTCGGWTGAHSNVIDKFSYATDGAASDVGNLTSAKYTPAGTQY